MASAGDRAHDVRAGHEDLTFWLGSASLTVTVVALVVSLLPMVSAMCGPYRRHVLTRLWPHEQMAGR